MLAIIFSACQIMTLPGIHDAAAAASALAEGENAQLSAGNKTLMPPMQESLP